MANWHASHGFSPRTGQPTDPEQGGWVRRVRRPTTGPRSSRAPTPRSSSASPTPTTGCCSARTRCGRRTASRCSPASSSRGSRSRPPCVREVFEESGVRVVDPVYLGSSRGRSRRRSCSDSARGSTPSRSRRSTPDGEEILELRWFTRDELRGARCGEIIAARPDLDRPRASSRTGTAARSTTAAW